MSRRAVAMGSPVRSAQAGAASAWCRGPGRPGSAGRIMEEVAQSGTPPAPDAFIHSVNGQPTVERPLYTMLGRVGRCGSPQPSHSEGRAEPPSGSGPSRIPLSPRPSICGTGPVCRHRPATGTGRPAGLRASPRGRCGRDLRCSGGPAVAEVELVGGRAGACAAPPDMCRGRCNAAWARTSCRRWPRRATCRCTVRRWPS
jgi:hypothetical protein